MGVRRRDLAILLQIAQKFGDNHGTIRGVIFFLRVYYAVDFLKDEHTGTQTLLP